MSAVADDLARAVGQLIGRVDHWTPPLWTASSLSGASRADVVHALAQEVADLAAAAESQPQRAVPRLDNDLALTDQLRVVVADLVTAEPGDEALARVTDLVTAVRHAL